MEHTSYYGLDEIGVGRIRKARGTVKEISQKFGFGEHFRASQLSNTHGNELDLLINMGVIKIEGWEEERIAIPSDKHDYYLVDERGRKHKSIHDIPSYCDMKKVELKSNKEEFVIRKYRVYSPKFHYYDTIREFDKLSKELVGIE